MKLVVVSVVVLVMLALAKAYPVEFVGASVVIALLAYKLRVYSPSAPTTIGHAHGGSTRFIGRHEAGHYWVARATGHRGLKVHADRHGGYVDATHVPIDPVYRIATFRAGQYAVGSTSGCSYDREMVRKLLRGVPAPERARVLAEGEALSRKLVRRHSGAIKRDGRTIAETGTL